MMTRTMARSSEGGPWNTLPKGGAARVCRWSADRRAEGRGVRRVPLHVTLPKVELAQRPLHGLNAHVVLEILESEGIDLIHHDVRLPVARDTKQQPNPHAAPNVRTPNV